jgi:hypothetical protein
MEIRSNKDLRILESLSRTITNSTVLRNENMPGGHFVLDVTTVGTGSITLSIDGFDAVSGKWYNILTGAAVTTNSTNVYRVYPGLTAAANAVVSDIIPHQFRATVTHNNANAVVYSLGASLVW